MAQDDHDETVAETMVANSRTKKTLAFPLDFFPNSLPAGFGDINGYAPTPFHYAAAMRFKQEFVMGASLDQQARTGCANLAAAVKN